jgi:hypothetical protein
VAAEHYTIFSGNDEVAENYFISDCYFRRNRQKFLDHRKYFWPIFDGFFLATENITDLFLTGFF